MYFASDDTGKTLIKCKYKFTSQQTITRSHFIRVFLLGHRVAEPKGVN